MFRAIVIQRENLDKPQVADVRVLSASSSEDLTQKATTTINIDKTPTNVKLNDLVGVYDNKGVFIYWGVISAIKDTKLTLNQPQSLFNDNHLIVAQTSTNQKAFYNNKPISYITDFYLKSKELGYETIRNTMGGSPTYIPTFTGLKDIDVANMYKGIDHRIFDDEQTFMPYPLEKETINLETYLYNTFNSYNRIVRLHKKIEKSILPIGYTQLEYIESTGTQWINTGYKLSNNCDVYIDYQLTKASSSTYLNRPFGARTGNNANQYAILFTSGGSAQSNLLFGNTSYNFGNSLAKDLTRHNIKIEGGKLYVDNVLKTSATGTFTNIYNAYIFAYNNGGSAMVDTYMKIYRFSIKENDVLVRDYIPAIRISDGQSGLYDLVNDVFYTNEGTGAFVVGEKKSLELFMFYPSGIIEYDNGEYWNYTEKKLFDTWELISNVQIVKEEEDCNTVAVYNNDGSTLRGAYTLLNDGTIVQVTADTPIVNRVGANKTKYVFDETNRVTDLVQKELPNILYNHKITFDIVFNENNKFSDYNLGQPIKFYSSVDNHLYSSILTGWKYNIEENSDEIKKATFILGKSRDTLTAKLQKKVKK